MYLVYGIDHDGNESKRLEYESLDDALNKLRDLVGADEIDDDGPMYREYGLAIHPMPQGPKTEGLYDEHGNRVSDANVPDFRTVPPADDGPRLRLRRD